MLRLLLLVVLGVSTTSAQLYNSGTPPGVPPSFDCKMRQLAWRYGQKLLPNRGGFRSLYDSLQLQACGVTPPPDSESGEWRPPVLPTPNTGTQIYVDAARGLDEASGALSSPVRSLARALALAAKATARPTTILLREGTYYVPATLQVGPEHSGVTVQNYAGERAVVSGGQLLSLRQTDWKPYRSGTGWEVFPGLNNVYGRASVSQDTACCKYVGTYLLAKQCQDAVAASSKGPFTSFTWHEFVLANGLYAGQCFGVRDGSWIPQQQANVQTGVFVKQNTWVADVTDANVTSIPSLNVNGQRAFRARWPNGNPEESGRWFFSQDQLLGIGLYDRGWIQGKTEWVPPGNQSSAASVVVGPSDWPDVEWPVSSARINSLYTSGIGGNCYDLEPPYGYWCSDNPPRGTFPHIAPWGVSYAPYVPRADKYLNVTGAVVHAWRGSDGRWLTWQFLVEGADRQNRTFDFAEGGYQGAEGGPAGAEWYIENVLEELDSPGEYFFNETTRKLYYHFNGSKPTGQEQFVATQLATIFNVSGTSAKPVRDFRITGLEFRDTRPTYLDDHGLPSGGDWALPYQSALTATGTENLTIDGNLFIRLDGSAVQLSGYHRKAVLRGNEFAYLGASAMVSWGQTSRCLNADCSKTLPWPFGPDGRSGEQAQGTLVEGNLAYELGVWVKQCAMWFQAITAATTFRGNVAFNGPRAAVVMNDGFAGGDLVTNNLLLNQVRESGDHGPFNSWDRIPYISTQRTGKPSVLPADRIITRNLMFGTYNTQENVDNDDGSQYQVVSNNVLVYGANGHKSFFGGQYNRHTGNIYAYVGNCFYAGNNDQHINNTCVLRSAGFGYQSDCLTPTGFQVGGNAVSNQAGQLSVCGLPLQLWVALGHDKGTTLSQWPSDDKLIAQATALLFSSDS